MYGILFLLFKTFKFANSFHFFSIKLEGTGFAYIMENFNHIRGVLRQVLVFYETSRFLPKTFWPPNSTTKEYKERVSNFSVSSKSILNFQQSFSFHSNHVKQCFPNFKVFPNLLLHLFDFFFRREYFVFFAKHWNRSRQTIVNQSKQIKHRWWSKF